MVVIVLSPPKTKKKPPPVDTIIDIDTYLERRQLLKASSGGQIAFVFAKATHVVHIHISTYILHSLIHLYNPRIYLYLERRELLGVLRDELRPEAQVTRLAVVGLSWVHK